MYDNRSSVVLLICSIISLTFGIATIVNRIQNKESETMNIEVVEENVDIDNNQEDFELDNEIVFEISKGGKIGIPYLTIDGKVYESYGVIEDKAFEDIVDNYIGYYEYDLKGVPNSIRMNVYSIENCSSNEWLVTYFYELNSGLVWREKNVTSELNNSIDIKKRKVTIKDEFERAEEEVKGIKMTINE